MTNDFMQESRACLAHDSPMPSIFANYAPTVARSAREDRKFRIIDKGESRFFFPRFLIAVEDEEISFRTPSIVDYLTRARKSVEFEGTRAIGLDASRVGRITGKTAMKGKLAPPACPR